MLSRTVLAHTQSCVIVASPADDQIQAVVLHLHDDLLDQHANNTFARGYGRPLRMPSALDVGAEPEQRLAFAWAYAIRGHHAEDTTPRASSWSWSRRSSFKRSFQRRSSSPATSRLSGSTASYCRRAYAVAKRACSTASSICRRFSASSRPRAPSAASDASTPRG